MTTGSACISFRSQKTCFNLRFEKDLTRINYSSWLNPGQAEREENRAFASCCKRAKQSQSISKMKQRYIINWRWMCLSKRLQCISHFLSTSPILTPKSSVAWDDSEWGWLDVASPSTAYCSGIDVTHSPLFWCCALSRANHSSLSAKGNLQLPASSIFFFFWGGPYSSHEFFTLPEETI